MLLGKITQLRGDAVVIDSAVPLATGDGIVLEGDRFAGREIGGRIYELVQNGHKSTPSSQALSKSIYSEVRFKYSKMRWSSVNESGRPTIHAWQASARQFRITRRQQTRAHRRDTLRGHRSTSYLDRLLP